MAQTLQPKTDQAVITVYQYKTINVWQALVDYNYTR